MLQPKKFGPGVRRLASGQTHMLCFGVSNVRFSGLDLKVYNTIHDGLVGFEHSGKAVCFGPLSDPLMALLPCVGGSC